MKNVIDVLCLTIVFISDDTRNLSQDHLLSLKETFTIWLYTDSNKQTRYCETVILHSSSRCDWFLFCWLCCREHCEWYLNRTPAHWDQIPGRHVHHLRRPTPHQEASAHRVVSPVLSSAVGRRGKGQTLATGRKREPDKWTPGQHVRYFLQKNRWWEFPWNLTGFSVFVVSWMQSRRQFREYLESSS